MGAPPKLPDRIADRLKALESEVQGVISKATAAFCTQLPGPIAFRYQHSAPGDILTMEERAQSVSFITRYEYLPDDYPVRLVEHSGNWYIDNLAFLRHALNDFRSIIQNQSDAVYYQRVHNVWYKALRRADPAKGLTVRALDAHGLDVTSTFAAWMGERNKAIVVALDAMEYKYLYNGILQHSDPRFSKRFLEDYVSGELNYLFWKHAYTLGFIREMLLPYYRLMNALTFPKLGPL